MSHYETPKHPLREALLALIGKEPPAYVKGYDTSNLTDRQQMDLQDWCSINAKPYWATGLSMIEAAEFIVSEAIGNANIKPKDPDEAPELGEAFFEDAILTSPGESLVGTVARKRKKI